MPRTCVHQASTLSVQGGGQMRPMRLACAFAMAGVFVVAGVASPAAAGGTPAGKCVGSAAVSGGREGSAPFPVNAEVPADHVTVVPKADIVRWQGGVVGPVAGVERPIAGFIAVDLPWPLGRQTVETWGGTSKKIGKAGIRDYDLPSSVPRGVEFRVVGEHNENGDLFCSGEATVKIEGSAFDSPATPVALVLSVASAVGLVFAGLGGRKL